MRASMQTLMLTYMHARAYTRTHMQVFLEFNINNGFLVADHGVEQCERMLAFFHDEYNARVR